MPDHEHFFQFNSVFIELLIEIKDTSIHWADSIITT